MRLSRWVLRSSFCLTGALVAASLADPIVEAISNAGVFGTAAYTDRSMMDVAPVFIAGALGVLLWIALQVRKALVPQDVRPHWLVQSAALLDARSVVRLLPALLALQIAVLFSMETLEQVAVYGHVLGPAIWLGGPAAFSLAFHALAGSAVAFGLANLVRRCAASLAVVIRLIARFLAAMVAHAPSASQLNSQAMGLRLPSPLPSRTGGRAPPLSA